MILSMSFCTVSASMELSFCICVVIISASMRSASLYFFLLFSSSSMTTLFSRAAVDLASSLVGSCERKYVSNPETLWDTDAFTCILTKIPLVPFFNCLLAISVRFPSSINLSLSLVIIILTSLSLRFSSSLSILDSFRFITFSRIFPFPIAPGSFPPWPASITINFIASLEVCPGSRGLP